MQRRMLVALMLLGAMASKPQGTTAYLTSTTVSPVASQFTAGSVILSTGGTTSALVVFSNIYPGASPVYGSVTVQNTGTSTLLYAISDTATNTDGKGLAGALQLTIARGSPASCQAGGFSSLTVEYATAALANTDGTARMLVGDAAAGSANAGNRSLAPSSADDLCFQVELPANAASSLQSASTTVTLTFTALQAAGT